MKRPSQRQDLELIGTISYIICSISIQVFYRFIHNFIVDNQSEDNKSAGIPGQQTVRNSTLESRSERLPHQLWRKKGTDREDRTEQQLPDAG